MFTFLLSSSYDKLESCWLATGYMCHYSIFRFITPHRLLMWLWISYLVRIFHCLLLSEAYVSQHNSYHESKLEFLEIQINVVLNPHQVNLSLPQTEIIIEKNHNHYKYRGTRLSPNSYINKALLYLRLNEHCIECLARL